MSVWLWARFKHTVMVAMYPDKDVQFVAVFVFSLDIH